MFLSVFSLDATSAACPLSSWLEDPRHERDLQRELPKRVVLPWHSRLLRIKNPSLEDVHKDEFDRTVKSEGQLLDAFAPESS